MHIPSFVKPRRGSKKGIKEGDQRWVVIAGKLNSNLKIWLSRIRLLFHLNPLCQDRKELDLGV
jgi:hypothetical protein